MRHVLTLAAALVVASGCQVYEFNPVQPLAISQTTQTKLVFSRTLKPNLMIMVDKSGSMLESVPGGGTRIAELQQAMNTFLTQHGAVARMGLVTFPVKGGNGWLPTSSVAVNLPAPADGDSDATAMVNQANATSINNAIQNGDAPTGGTPTNFSLQFVGSIPGLNDANDRRDDYVLLLTDGLPNCNSMAQVTCGSAGSCYCTLGAAGCNSAGGCPIGCLDETGVEAAVRALRTKNIKTIVVGFGDALNPNNQTDDGRAATRVLNSMANEGGFARTCAMDADCGSTSNDKCESGLCNRRFFSAANGAQLSAALTAILDRVVTTNVCELELETIPESESYISVLVNEEVQLPGAETWKLDGARLIFQGALCRRFQTALDISPLSLEVRAVDVL